MTYIPYTRARSEREALHTATFFPAKIVRSEGGWLLFRTAQDFLAWKKQK